MLKHVFSSPGGLYKSNFNVRYSFTCSLYVNSHALVADEAFLPERPSNKLTAGRLWSTQNIRSPAEQSTSALVHENETHRALNTVTRKRKGSLTTAILHMPPLYFHLSVLF